MCSLFVATETAAVISSFPHIWSQRFGITGRHSASTVAVDGSGNVIVAGYTTGAVDFGGGVLSSTGPFDFDVFVAKFGASGAHHWSKSFGGPDGQPQEATSVAVDPFGNVVVVGYFRGTVNFGGADLTSAGGPFDLDIFVAKFFSNGFHYWSQGFGDASNQSASSVAVDAIGNVTITGDFYGAVDFGGGPLTSAGAQDIFVASFDGDGNHRWSQRFGNTGAQSASSVATDASDNVIIAGSVTGTIDFGGGDLTGAGGTDVFLAKFTSLGNHIWSQRFGDATTYAGAVATTDPSGNVLVGGTLSAGTINFGGGNLTGAGQGDIVLARFDAAGVHQWSQRFGDAEQQFVNAVTADIGGNVTVVGRASSNSVFSFGGGNLAGPGRICIAKFTPAGVHEASWRYGDGAFGNPRSVDTDAAGNLLVAGEFVGTVDFGGGGMTSASPGDEDAFVAKLGGQPGEPMITSILDIGNDQGRHVKIRFNRSGADDAQVSSPIIRYDAFRRDDAAPTASAASHPRDDTGRQPLMDGWTQVGSVSAYGESTYGIDVPTIGDSTIAQGQYHSTFLIRAATTIPTTFYDSSPDSGYSVDNLAPSIPQALVYNAGALAWNPSTAADFDYFSVYGGNGGSFASATLIDYTVAPSLNVSASPYTFYFVTATDFSGNEGSPALFNAASGVGGTPKSYILSISSYPNPFNPTTTIRYTLPSRGPTQVSIYDARGSRVATLVDEVKDSGAYTQSWDGRRTAGGVAGSGIYFVRVTHPSGAKSYKIVLLK